MDGSLLGEYLVNKGWIMGDLTLLREWFLPLPYVGNRAFTERFFGFSSSLLILGAQIKIAINQKLRMSH